MVTIMEISSVSANAVMVHEFEYTDDVISTTVGYVDGSSSRISLLTTAPASDVSVTLSLSTTATSLVDQMSYLVDNQSSTCDFCVFSALPLPVPNNVRNGFVASGNASLTPTVSGDVTTFHLALSTAIALTVGALFAIFAVYETFRLMLGIAIRRKRQEGGLLTISVHLLLALFSVSDVAVCLAAVSCRPALRLSHCILLSTLSDLILPVMASSFALQTSLVVRRRRRRSLATTASVGDVSNFRYDCYPNVIVQPHQMGLIVAAAFFVYVILTCGTGFVDVLHENGIIENDTIQLLPVQIVIRVRKSLLLFYYHQSSAVFSRR